MKTTVMLDTSWRKKAACAGVSTATFYDHVERMNIGESKMIADRAVTRFCSKCEVREECLEFALATNERDGIWGGLTEKERQSVRRARARARKQAENSDVV